jgi:enamine deaminase RidA (YjgF/YER057c/UK114 family)
VPVLDHLTEVPGLGPAVGYAHAVTVTGRLAFVSGQIPLDADGNLVGADDIAAQTGQVLLNLHRVLQTLGADWPDVVRFGWYVLDTTQLQTIRDVRDAVIRPSLGDRPNPASTLVQVAGLIRPGFLVEVDAVVTLPD